MEPISIRKLDNFYGKDRRIINTGLLRSDNTSEEMINQSTYAKNYSRRSLLNYDGNSLFAGYGSSFYNPFFNKVFLNYAGAPSSPYYGYLHKTSRDIITLPVYSPTNSVGAVYTDSEFDTDPNIWSNYMGKDLTMNHYGLILRSDGHYIMEPLDNYSADLNQKENNSSVFYYVPFFAPDMYDEALKPFNGCPNGYTNIIIGPPDIFTIGQTYYALLDFEPYIRKYPEEKNIYTVIRMATSQLETCDGSHVYNRMNNWNYINSCAYINILNDVQIHQNNSDNTRTIDILKRTQNDYNNKTNTLMYIKAGGNKNSQSYRSSLAVLLEWKWGLRNSPFSVAKELEEQNEFMLTVDTLSTANLSSGVPRSVYYCPFLEISARVVLGIDFLQCNKTFDYNNVGDISSLFS